MVSFYTPWKHQKNSSFSDVSRGYRNRQVTWNGLIKTLDQFNECCFVEYVQSRQLIYRIMSFDVVLVLWFSTLSTFSAIILSLITFSNHLPSGKNILIYKKQFKISNTNIIIEVKVHSLTNNKVTRTTSWHWLDL